MLRFVVYDSYSSIREILLAGQFVIVKFKLQFEMQQSANCTR